MFNPFNLAKCTDEDLIKRIETLLSKINENGDMIGELSNTVIILSDVLPIYGELTTRLQKEYSLTKYENGIKETKIAYELKSQSTTKLPVSYFNALAQEKMLEDKKKEFELQMKTQQMKYAFEATQEKINAIKKKMDSIKFESQY